MMNENSNCELQHGGLNSLGPTCFQSIQNILRARNPTGGASKSYP